MTTVRASRRRLILAIYLDLVVFGAVWGLCTHFVAPGASKSLVQYLAFGLLEVLLLTVVKWSPGEFLLSIGHPRLPADPIEPEGGEPRRIAVTDRRIWSAENAVTVIVGVFLVMEGSKSLVRWTMWTPPQPFFGIRLDSEWGAVLGVGEGVAQLALGALVLRLHRLAPAAVTAYCVYQLTAVIASWRLWDEFAREMVHNRRLYQGLPVRPGEVEFAQWLTAEAAIVTTLVLIAAVWWTRARFVPPRGAQGERLTSGCS